MFDFKTLKFNQSDIFGGGSESLCGHPFSSLPLLNITVKANKQFGEEGGEG